MNARVLISVLVLVAVSLAVTLWIGGATTSSAPLNPQRSATGSSLEIDREPPFPVATADETEHFFETMEVGQTGEHIFIIRNTGEDILRIEKGTSTCKCTLSNLDDPEIAPGQSTEIKLEWTPESATDQFSQIATIFTNDPENQVIEFSINGRVLKPIEIQPSDFVNAGNVVENVGAKGRSTIFSQMREKLDPPTVKYEGDQMTFEVVPMSDSELSEYQAKVGYVVEILVQPTIPVGPFRDQFTLEYTVDGESRSVHKSVNAERRGPIRFLNAPGTSFIHEIQLLRLGRFAAKDGKQAKLTLLIDQPESGEKVEITSFESARVPWLKLTAVENTELDIPTRAAFDLLIEMPPGHPPVDVPRSRTNLLVLRTNHPLVKEVSIYVELRSY